MFRLYTRSGSSRTSLKWMFFHLTVLISRPTHQGTKKGHFLSVKENSPSGVTGIEPAISGFTGYCAPVSRRILLYETVSACGEVFKLICCRVGAYFTEDGVSHYEGCICGGGGYLTVSSDSGGGVGLLSLIPSAFPESCESSHYDDIHVFDAISALHYH